MEALEASFKGFGYREMVMAAELLEAYANSDTGNIRQLLGNDISIGYNPNSDTVYLVDEDYNVAIFNDDGKLELLKKCGYCGFEAVASEFDKAKVDEDKPHKQSAHEECKDCKKMNGRMCNAHELLTN